MLIALLAMGFHFSQEDTHIYLRSNHISCSQKTVHYTSKVDAHFHALVMKQHKLSHLIQKVVDVQSIMFLLLFKHFVHQKHNHLNIELQVTQMQLTQFFMLMGILTMLVLLRNLLLILLEESFRLGCRFLLVGVHRLFFYLVALV